MSVDMYVFAKVSQLSRVYSDRPVGDIFQVFNPNSLG
jgi:hypothetical protein